jgi:hypothetical protein
MGARGRAAPGNTAALSFERSKPESTDMNPEIRAILFALLIAALARPAILALFYSPGAP